MAYPQVAAYSQGTTARDTSHTISLPSGIVAGHLLVVIFSTDGDNTITDWDGFTGLFSMSNGTAASLHFGYKIAVGSDTLTITTSSSEECSYVCFRIPDHDSASNPPEVSSGATGSNDSPDPDQITMSLSKEYMFIACEGSDHLDTVTAFPSTHQMNKFTQNGGGSGSCGVGVATREYTGTVDNPAVFTLQSGEQWVACTVAIYPADGGWEIPVNQVFEIDTSQTIGRIKTKTTGQVSETDLAQPVARVKTKTFGQITETDLAQAIVWAPKNRLVNQVPETDLAQGIAWAPKNRLVNQVTETNLSQALTSAKLKAIAQVIETDLAQSLGRLKALTIAQVQETDLAHQITTGGQTVVVNQVAETDLSQVVARIKTRLIGQILETDLSQAIASLKERQIGQVTETDLAQAIVWAPKNRLIGQVVESNLAQAIGRLKAVLIGQTIETDLAQAITWAPKNRLVNQVQETDLAQTITAAGAGGPCGHPPNYSTSLL